MFEFWGAYSIHRSGKHDVNDITMSYSVQNDEDGKRLVFRMECGYNNYFVFVSPPEVVKKLPGIRKYVDPQNYASPDAALKDFALEIPSHQLRLDEVIGGGKINMILLKVCEAFRQS